MDAGRTIRRTASSSWRTKSGCLFDRNADGTIHQKPFAGQIFRSDGAQGRSDRHRDHVQPPRLHAGGGQRHGPGRVPRAGPFDRGFEAFAGRCCLITGAGSSSQVRAKATLLCTGAGATMYRISSPSLEKAGDGQAMAWRAGAEFVDMEMMQFHPTGLLVGRSIATGGLLEEGLRGAGARLFNGLGERFMEKYAPDKLERATRDVVTPLELHGDHGGPGNAAGRGVDRRVAPGRGRSCCKISAGCASGARTMGSTWRGRASRCRPARITTWAASRSTWTAAAISKACSSREKTRAACTARTGWAATASPTRSSSAPRGRRDGGVRRVRAGLRRASPGRRCEALRNTGLGPLIGARERIVRAPRKLEDLMWEKVGVVRNGPDLKAAIETIGRLRKCAEARSRPARRSIIPGGTRRSTW